MKHISAVVTCTYRQLHYYARGDKSLPCSTRVSDATTKTTIIVIVVIISKVHLVTGHEGPERELCIALFFL